ncbi:MAG: competence/damage-inducible protein A [Nitrospinota bacterium]|nr:MAG: competence/damage-inducible protein A [Nitrospinota bacterium]
MEERRAIIVTIGNELLSGEVENTNATWLARELYALGVLVHQILTLPDEIAVIVRMLQPLRTEYDYVLISGGVGPTPDDVTRPALARLLGVPLEPHPDALALLQARFQGSSNAAVLAMADLPRGALVKIDSHLLFPGFILENLYVLPGVPRIMQRIFALLRDRLRTRPFLTCSLHTTQKETAFAHLLVELSRRFPSVQVGSYPTTSEGEYQVRIVLKSKEPQSLQQAKSWLETRMQP